MKNVSIGIDVGGTNTVIGVVDRDGKVLVKDSIKTPPAHGDISQFIDDITKSVRDLVHAVVASTRRLRYWGAWNRCA